MQACMACSCLACQISCMIAIPDRRDACHGMTMQQSACRMMQACSSKPREPMLDAISSCCTEQPAFSASTEAMDVLLCAQQEAALST